MLDTYEYVEVNTPQEEKADWVLDALKDSEIHPGKQYHKPEIIFQIREHGAMQFEYRRVFTLGNFSAITGKAKSKKTYLLSAIASCILGRRLMWDKFQGGLIEGKEMVLYFDTEQGTYDSWNVIRRIAVMAGTAERFRAFNLRRFTPSERCQIIEFAMMMHGNEAGLVIIDGIADLATAINDEDEATRVVSLLLRWTKDYNCHIATVIHQNKGDNFATGHLGSSIMKKCEVIISVTKEGWDSIVECQMIRGAQDFKPFKLAINSEGMPEIDSVAIETGEVDFSKINNKTPFD